MKKTQEIFIQNLCRLRKARYSTQADFADKVNLSLRGYQKYEQGESAPTPDILDRFAIALKCKPWQLVTPEGEDVSRHLDQARAEALGYLMTMEDLDLRKFLHFWREKRPTSSATKKNESGF